MTGARDGTGGAHDTRDVTRIMQATQSGVRRSKRDPMVWLVDLARSVPPSLLALLPAAGLALGCTASAEQVKPPDDLLYFPTGAAIAPDESHLFVTNANSELRYDSGSISVLALASVDQIASDWTRDGTARSGCFQDGANLETLVCPAPVLLDETRDQGVRIGNFASELAIQDTNVGGGELRLITPTRGDPSVAWIDWNGARLGCNANGEGFALCDDTHRLAFVLNNSDNPPLPEEPFGVYADTAGEFAVVTHLTTGAVTLIDSPRGGDARVTDISAGIFLPDATTGLRGATGVAGRTSGPSDILYVGSRTEDRIQTFTVERPVNAAPPFLIQGGFFFLDAVGGSNGGSSDTRGMTFSRDGQRLYLVNRRPPSLQIYDTAVGPTGAPRNTPLGATDLCRQASTVTVADAGDGERAYVTCFQDGQLYIVDPRGEGSVEAIVTVGRGPYSVVAAPGRKKLYVTNFLEDTIAVVDIDPTSRLRNRVVLRIGEPRPL